MSAIPQPLFVAIVDDSPITVLGVTALLRPFGRRVRVAAYNDRLPRQGRADVVLYDPFVPPNTLDRLREITTQSGALVMVFTSMMEGAQLDETIRAGIAGFLSKTVDGVTMMAALERVASRDEARIAIERPGLLPSSTWPGERDGLTARESAVVSLIVSGMTNEDIAIALHVNTESLKTCARSAYRTMGVTSRAEAVSWGIAHGFQLASPAVRVDDGAQP